MLIYTPWTEEQVKNLNNYQKREDVHEYTCGYCRKALIATKDGWICVCGKHKQDWCLDWTANSEW